MRLEEIAQILEADLQGDGSLEVFSIAPMPESAEAEQIALVFPSKFSKAQKILRNCNAKAILISKELNEDSEFQDYFKKNFSNISLLVVNRPKFALMKLIKFFEKPRYLPRGIHPSAVIDSNTTIEDEVSIGALSFIGPNTKIYKGTVIYPRVYIGANVTIGENCEIHAGVVIEDYSQIGSRVIIQSNSVVGSDGYSYITEEPSNLEKLQKGDFNFTFDRQIQHKINSAGNVIIDDDVEIGANTCIDRGTIGPTTIGKGTKIDNLCQIAHNVQIGKDCLIIANTGIAGSAKINDRVTMAGASGCADGVEIGNDVVVGAYAAVNSDLDPFLPVLGIPAIPYGEFMKRQRALIRLPKLVEEFRKLKSKVDELVRGFETTRK